MPSFRGPKHCPVCQQVIEPTAGLTGQVALLDSFTTHVRLNHPDFLAWEKSRLKYGVMIGAISGLVTGIATIGLGIYVFHLPSSAGRVLAVIPFLGFLLPIALINKLGARKYAEQWRNRPVSLPPEAPQVPVGNPDLIPSPQRDQEMLSITRDLTMRLGIENFNPEAIHWQTLVPRGNRFDTVLSDRSIIRGTSLYFAENMRDRLSPEDWRPVIASSLVYDKRIHNKVAIGILAKLVPIMIVCLIGWILLPPLFPTITYYDSKGNPASYWNNGWLIMIVTGFAIMFALIPIVSYWLRGYRDRADRIAAQTVGTTQFIESLRKIGQASPSNLDGVTRRMKKLETGD